MQWRMTEHEIRARLADLHAILHQSDMARIRMRPPFGEAVLNGLKACRVTLLAEFHAPLHLFVHDIWSAVFLRRIFFAALVGTAV
jgi:hypothetical protein